jgi:hypothetical protein
VKEESDTEVSTQNSTIGLGQTDSDHFVEDQRDIFAFEVLCDIEFRDPLEGNIAANGIKKSAEATLANGDLKKEILKQLFKETTGEMQLCFS